MVAHETGCLRRILPRQQLPVDPLDHPHHLPRHDLRSHLIRSEVLDVREMAVVTFCSQRLRDEFHPLLELALADVGRKNLQVGELGRQSRDLRGIVTLLPRRACCTHT